MAGQESSNNNKYEALIPKFQYKRPDAQREMFPNTDDLFKPRVVSLGPVYHTEKNWQVTKDDKSKIKEVLDRKKAGDFDSDEMKIALVVARSLYHEEKLDDNFDEMMILDACFIIHAIDYITKGESEVLDKRPHLLPLILEDMFLLENQIPIIVLEAAMNVLGRKYPEDINEFIKKITRSPNGARTLCDYVMELPCPIQFLVFLLVCLIAPAMLLFLLVVVLPLALLILLVVCLPLGLVCLLCQKRCTEPQGGVGTEKQRDLEQPTKQEGSKEECVEQASGQEPSHLLHLLRAHLLSCSEENQHAAATHDNTWLPPRRATELTDAGIKFERSPTSSLKDVTFKKGIIYGYIYLPSLAQLTKTRLVNLMVYELCQGVRGHGITSYVSFLDGFIDCPEDVKELRSTQILPKALGGDEEVTHFFNNVGNFLAPFAYPNVLKEIESYCHSRWRPSTAKLCRKHFSSLWTTVSLLITILLFVITIATAYKNFFGRK